MSEVVLPCPLVELRACGRDWRLRKADMEQLWEHMTERNREPDEPEERPPYWAELWPASLALARWLESRWDSIEGKACLDMGCGLGFTALIGQWLGGKVSAMDYEERALALARENAQLNGIEGVRWDCMDWRRPGYAARSQEIIWAGDIMYERVFAEPIAAFLAHCLAPRGLAWIAEPGRELFNHLLKELPKHGLSPRKAAQFDVWPLIPQPVPVPVTIWEICAIAD